MGIGVSQGYVLQEDQREERACRQAAVGLWFRLSALSYISHTFRYRRQYYMGFDAPSVPQSLPLTSQTGTSFPSILSLVLLSILSIAFYFVLQDLQSSLPFTLSLTCGKFRLLCDDRDPFGWVLSRGGAPGVEIWTVCWV